MRYTKRIGNTNQQKIGTMQSQNMRLSYQQTVLWAVGSLKCSFDRYIGFFFLFLTYWISHIFIFLWNNILRVCHFQFCIDFYFCACCSPLSSHLFACLFRLSKQRGYSCVACCRTPWLESLYCINCPLIKLPRLGG